MTSQKSKYRIRREKAKESQKVRAIPKTLKTDLADSTSANMGAKWQKRIVYSVTTTNDSVLTPSTQMLKKKKRK